MFKLRTILLSTLSLTLIAVAGGEVMAKSSKSSKKVQIPAQSSGRKVVAQPKTKSVSRLPTNHKPVNVGGVSLFFSNGKYYRKSGVTFSLVLPPVGLRVATLPPSPKPFRYNNVVYYCDAGAIYQETNSGDYEVITPTVGMVVPELPEINVTQVSINGKIFYEYDDLLYKPVVTTDGVQYEVVGNVE